MGPGYERRGRKIFNRVCEINIAEHCNLACRACSHLSPVIRRSTVDAADVFRDLRILARYYRVGEVKLLGGEPLLHPDVTSVIDAVRRSGMTERIAIATNGVLLSKMGPDFWRAIDRVRVTVYPGFGTAKGVRSAVADTARDHGVELEIRECDEFRESFAQLGTKDRSLAQRIYESCEIAHAWRCHTVADGHFYKCPQAYFGPKVVTACSQHSDGLRIEDRPDFGSDLLAYLESATALATCGYCLGTAGKRVRHQQIAREEFQPAQRYATEELVDRRYLEVVPIPPQRPGRGLRWKRRAKRVLSRLG